jgi:hypothetical protein
MVTPRDEFAPHAERHALYSQLGAVHREAAGVTDGLYRRLAAVTG